MGGIMTATQQKVQEVADSTIARFVTRAVSFLLVPAIMAFVGFLWTSNNRLGAVEAGITATNAGLAVSRESAAVSRLEIIGRLENVERQNVRDMELTGEIRQSLSAVRAQNEFIVGAIRRLEANIDQDRRGR